MTELRFEKKKMRAAELGEQSSIPDLLGERILQNHLEFRLDEEDEIYEGYGRRDNAYPYRQYNSYTRELTEKEIKTAVLENKYLKAVFLPEYGGRLWELWDKERGRNLLYTNDVLRFSNLAVRNAWFSGGVEWNIGIIGHSPFTTDALYTAAAETEAGTPVLRMYEYERIRKVTYQMDFWLEEESRFLNCRMRIVNESAEVIPMYWWSNIAVPEYENGRILVPADKAFTYADGAVYKVEIPVVDGIDITDYKKIPRSVDYFFDIPEESPKYIANIDASGYGLLQRSTRRLRSRKLFSWGNQMPSDHWQEFLTEQAGRYLEIQAGLGKTQYGCIPMAPHTAWEWMEQYGAVQVPEEIRSKEHKVRREYLTDKVLRLQKEDDLEEKLQKTKKWAKKQAKLHDAGSGYGCLHAQKEGTAHLEFVMQDGLQPWKKFLDTAVLHCPDPAKKPDAFLIDEENLELLEKSVKKENKDNWYAYYHLGIGLYLIKEYEKAEQAFLRSLELEDNAWALHGLSCTYMLLDRKKESAEAICRGMDKRRKDISYLKEGFKILFLCGAYERLCQYYKKLGAKEQRIGKIKYYYIYAVCEMGEYETAYALLEENGGLEIEDIREGEDSVAQLWSILYEKVYGKKGKVPYKYAFKAY